MNHVVFAKKRHRVAAGFFAEGVLLERLVVHEDVPVRIAIQVLPFPLVHVRPFETVAAFICAVELRALEEVLQSRAIQRLAFARLDEITLQHLVRITVNDDLESLDSSSERPRH